MRRPTQDVGTVKRVRTRDQRSPDKYRVCVLGYVRESWENAIKPHNHNFTVKLGFNNHSYIEFTTISNKIQ